MQQRQLPVRPAFVMTNNKVQRQNLCQSGPTCPNLPSHMASCMLLAPMSVLGTVCVFVCRHHHHSHQHQNHCLQVAALFVSLKEIFLLLSLLAVQKLLLRSTTITVVDGGDFLAVASFALFLRYTNIATKQARPPRSIYESLCGNNSYAFCLSACGGETPALLSAALQSRLRISEKVAAMMHWPAAWPNKHAKNAAPHCSDP
jgi:hypothetical protein